MQRVILIVQEMKVESVEDIPGGKTYYNTSVYRSQVLAIFAQCLIKKWGDRSLPRQEKFNGILHI